MNRALSANGLDLRRAGRAATELVGYRRRRRQYLQELHAEDPSAVVCSFPVLGDRSAAAGADNGHYFLQDLHVARLIRDAAPERHLDIGSRIDGFVAHLLMFRDVDVLDVRPLHTTVDGLRFIQGNATDLRPFDDESIPSLSCLHALEHFGLGRYGDPVDPGSPRRALEEFTRVLAPSGRLYLSVPIGWPRVEFDAHRVFDPASVPQLASGLELIRFDAIDDSGRLEIETSPSLYSGADYSLGIYVFEKPRCDDTSR
jgi:SAM-dependent methyltransferase